MGYRGRLLFPLQAEIHRLDTAATQSAGGYDPTWQTPTVTYGDDGTRTRGLVYMTPPVILRCQIEQVTEAQQQRTPSGVIPDSKLVLVFHYADLALLDLVGGDGRPLIRLNDKLTKLLTKAGAPEKTFTPELYATEVLDGGHGLGGRRNLAIVTFEDRPKGA